MIYGDSFLHINFSFFPLSSFPLRSLECQKRCTPKTKVMKKINPLRTDLCARKIAFRTRMHYFIARDRKTVELFFLTVHPRHWSFELGEPEKKSKSEFVFDFRPGKSHDGPNRETGRGTVFRKYLFIHTSDFTVYVRVVEVRWWRRLSSRPQKRRRGSKNSNLI